MSQCLIFVNYFCSEHIALKYLIDLRDPRGRLARWEAFLMGYDIRNNHKPGRLLTDADAISRLCLQSGEEKTQETALLVSSEEPQGKVNDTKDVNEEGEFSSRRLVIKSMDKLEVLRRYHDDEESEGHGGFLGTYYKIKARFFWSKMKDEIKEYIRSGHTC